MEKRLSRFGIGPKIILATLTYSALAGAAVYAWPGACVLRWLPYPVCVTASVLLLAIGLPMWAVAVFSVMRAYNHDQLVTSGVFGLVRHPVYSAWIVLNVPGLVLLSRSWPLMVAPLVGYTVFKALIHTEDEYLRQRFGQAYLDYRARVNEVVPIPRFWRTGAL